VVRNEISSHVLVKNMNRRRYLALTLSVIGLAAFTEGARGDAGRGGTATSTPTATQTSVPTAEPTKFSGNGSQATDRFTVRQPVVFVELQHSGEGYFGVWLLNAQGEQVDLLANTIGTYRGTVLRNLESGDYFFDIDADGRWSVSVSQTSPPDSGAEPSISKEATGSSVLGPFQSNGAVRMTFEGSDQSHYGVWLRGADASPRDLLFNEIGPTDQLSTVFPGEGVFFITIETDGGWSAGVTPA
jgi:hypothetical protein